MTTRLDGFNFSNNNEEATSPYIKDIKTRLKDDVRRGIAPHNSEYGDIIEEERHEADDHADLDKYICVELLLDVGGTRLLAELSNDHGDLMALESVDLTRIHYSKVPLISLNSQTVQWTSTWLI